MIDLILKYLGEMPKRKREALLTSIDIVTWMPIFLDWFGIIKMPLFIWSIDLFVSVVFLAIHVRLAQIGGWWWTDDDEN